MELKSLTVWLRLYKPVRQDNRLINEIIISRGTIINANTLVKLRHGIPEWYNYLAHLASSGYTICRVEKVFNKEYEEIKIPKKIVDEVENVYKEQKQSKDLERQKAEEKSRIEQLEAQVAELINANADQKRGAADVAIEVEKAIKLRDEYEELKSKDIDLPKEPVKKKGRPRKVTP